MTADPANRPIFAIGDSVILDPIHYPRRKYQVAVIDRPHPFGVPGRWGVTFNGILHPYPVRETSMTRA
jgi:hypothetical protein